MIETSIRRTSVSRERVPSSFRDPSGYVYKEDGRLFRRIEFSYAEHYNRLMSSGLYEKLTARGLLIKHAEVDSPEDLHGAFKVIRPEVVAFLSHPFEWSFSQLRDAAATILEIALAALEHNMILKDASAYNIQFHNGRAVLIDSLSFESYVPGEPWIAYRQFCEHFLAPLAIQSLTDFRLATMLQPYLNGIPLDLAVKILPWQSTFQPGLFMHLHLHSLAQKKYEGKAVRPAAVNMSKLALTALLDSLLSCVQSLKLGDNSSEWSDYYSDTNYSDTSLKAKEDIVADLLRQLAPDVVWDCGANTGRFSRIAASIAPLVISTDMDPLCVNRNYQNCKQDKVRNVLPLIVDMTVPSPALGWNNEERQSIFERAPVNTVMALALIHHLAITNNVPFSMVAQCFARLGKNLIIEFVDKKDSQVQRLLASRKDIFDRYDETNFVKDFSLYFDLVSRHEVPQTGRVVYLFRSRET